MPLQKFARVADEKLTAVSVLAGSGIVQPLSPRAITGMLRVIRQWGLGPAGGFAALAVRSPHRLGLIDEVGALTFGEIDARGNAVAHALAGMGVKAGDGVAIMCRNHRGFVDASLGAAKLGADMLYLNTAFAGPQLVEVLNREMPAAVIYDEEFTDLLAGAGEIQRIVAWNDGDVMNVPTLEQLIAHGNSTPLEAPPKPGRIVILTSGTTGTPKGAPRSEAGIDAAVALLSRIPLKRGWRTHIAAPLFHTWGFAHMMLAMLLESTMVLRRRFDPEDCLKALVDERCDSLVVIPVMLQRMLHLPQEVKDSYDLSRVKVVASSGSALPGDLGLEWMDQFGDNLYNIYGSTEVAYASIATPDDLRKAPGTAGKPPYKTTVRLYDAEGRPSAPGEPGRIFVGNGMLFEGYTGGGGKAMIDGLMSSGDVGRFDAEGRLFVEGRDDEMIVSGGENVFPKEVEDCLARHEGVAEAAAIGVDDEEFGKRLRAFVVLKKGSDVDEDALKEHVKANLARFKVPREIVVLPELPRNATGKVLKRELHEWK